MSNIIIGGNGFRWRGKSIRTTIKNNMTCVTMPRQDSMVMVPCKVEKSTQYKLTVTASRSTGGGPILVNFFCGLNFDGEHKAVQVSSTSMHNYSFLIKTPNFPNAQTVYLRIWKPHGTSGNVFVRSVMCEKHLAGSNIIQSKTPVKQTMTVPLPKPANERGKIDRLRKKAIENRKKERVREKRRKLLQGRKISKPIENRSMRFKPFDTSVGEKIRKVLIAKADDVPMVSIITPTRDGLDLIKACYDAINKNTSYPNWEWIIGDSNSEDGTAEYIKSLKDNRIKLIERGTTSGSFSSINNELVGFSSGEYLLFLNDDTEPQPFWLYEMMSKIYRKDDIGVVGARLMYSANKIQHVGIAFIPQGPANICKSVLKGYPKGFEVEDRFHQAVTAACMLMRKSDFSEVSGFDGVYYFCYEDVDLCLKIRKQLGKKVLYAANAIVYHKESITQKKHKTGGDLQKNGISVFKTRWMGGVEKDFVKYRLDIKKNVSKIDISFVTCVNNLKQYRDMVVGSLFKNKTKRKYEIIPIINFGNKHSAAEALNIGIEKARANIVVLCHQDVLFYENWIDMLFTRISEVEAITKKWGVLGTAGIGTKDDTCGVVHNMRGRLQWQSSRKVKVGRVQTVDEHCMIIKKDSKLRFDKNTFNGFHFYGPDICLSSLHRGLFNFGILCPLIHHSNSGSLVSGKKEFMRLLNALAKKWRGRFSLIRTPTSIINNRTVRTFVKFN